MTFKGELHPFQARAVERMLEQRTFLLAHDLGLGKTISSIAAIESLIDTGEVQGALVVCPASVKWQWKRQIEAFTDGALVKVVDGGKGDRRTIYRAYKRGDVEYLIVNYEQIVRDWEIIRFLVFDAIICDEIVAIKNFNTLRSKYVKRLTAPYRFGLSGQPIENRPEELFSIMQWVNPDVLGEAEKFERTFIRRNAYGKAKKFRNLRLLREDLMGGWMDRVTRFDVRDQMPAVVEQSYVIDFDPAGQQLYTRIAYELLQEIRATPKFGTFDLTDHYAGVGGTEALGGIMAKLSVLRMLCDHPALLTYSANRFDDPDTRAGSKYAADLRRQGALEKLRLTPKMTVTIDVIKDVLEANPKNRVVVFSFFKPMLALLGEELHKLGVGYVIYTGDLSPKERDEAVQRFSVDTRCRVFLSSDAGGVGVDIPVANYLISYDLPWSAGLWAQRNGRILRISSTWPEVTLLSMVMRETIEERMLAMLDTKRQVAEAWLDGRHLDQHGGFAVTLGTLASFLENPTGSP